MSYKENNQLKNTIEKISHSFEKLKNLEKDLIENPNNIINYFEKTPYLFTAIYLSFRKYYMNDFIRFPIEFQLSNNPNNNTIFNYSLFKYFCNEDIESKTDNYDIDLDEGIFLKISLIFKLLCNIYEEIKKLNYEYSVLMNVEYNDYFDIDLGNEVSHMSIYPDIYFQNFFLIPIFNGKYDNELEKLAKKCLMELKLEKK